MRAEQLPRRNGLLAKETLPRGGSEDCRACLAILDGESLQRTRTGSVKGSTEPFRVGEFASLVFEGTVLGTDALP